ncbi:MAG: hypothetical protein ACJ8LN_03345, partial [Sulfurifustis sp.]
EETRTETASYALLVRVFTRQPLAHVRTPDAVFELDKRAHRVGAIGDFVARLDQGRDTRDGQFGFH